MRGFLAWLTHTVIWCDIWHQRNFRGEDGNLAYHYCPKCDKIRTEPVWE